MDPVMIGGMAVRCQHRLGFLGWCALFIHIRSSVRFRMHTQYDVKVDDYDKNSIISYYTI